VNFWRAAQERVGKALRGDGEVADDEDVFEDAQEEATPDDEEVTEPFVDAREDLPPRKKLREASTTFLLREGERGLEILLGAWPSSPLGYLETPWVASADSETARQTA